MEILHITKDLLKYESFINDVLRVELSDVCQRLDETNSEVMEYVQLKNVIETFQEMNAAKETFKSMVDIGCSFYMQAHTEDVSKILINITGEYFIEFTLEEALKFVKDRIGSLEARIDSLRDQSSSIKAHIKLLLTFMQQWPSADIENR